ncbi:MAG: hypothetical protein WC637_00030 [Victivallales bacterium]|jgi:hypothetical protein
MKKRIILTSIILVMLTAFFATAGPRITQQNSYAPGSVAITGGTITGLTNLVSSGGSLSGFTLLSGNTITGTGLAPSKAVVTNASKNLASSDDITAFVTAASATTAGKVELATEAEAILTSMNTVAVTPEGLVGKLASPGAIGGTTAGTLRYILDEDVVTSSSTLTVNQVSGALINNYGQADDTVIYLPTAAAGYNFTAIIGQTVAKYLRIRAGAADKIYLDGAAGNDSGYVYVSYTTIGNALSCVAFQTDAYDWYCATISGAWAAGGP